MTMEAVDSPLRGRNGSAAAILQAGLALLVSGLASNAIAAQRGPTVAEEYAASINARSSIAPLSVDDMFGDRIGLFTGSVEFLHTDISIPGNGPEVAIRRRIKAGSQGIMGLGMFGNWDMAIPSMHGLFSTQGGWRNYSVTDPLKRCSKYMAPADETISHAIPTTNGGVTLTRTFSADEFWHGTFLYLPQTGDEELLAAGNAWPKPSDAHILRTKSGAAIRCIPTNSGTGEGFEVTTPDGMTYRLDHMATGISLRPLIKSPHAIADGADHEYVLYRQEFFLLPTLVTDRFGNTVTYTWDQTIPKQLKRIASSDGRILDITWTDGQISKITHGNRVWIYAGNRITLPDLSFWLVGSPVVPASGTSTAPSENADCTGPGIPGHIFTSSFTHPSGATATFTFKPTLHGRAWSTYLCRLGEPIPGNSFNGSFEMFPAKYYTWSLTSKTISGPGLPSLTWTYTYGPDNGCYAANRGSLNCSSTSPTTKWVDVRDPSNITTRYTFGIKHNVDDGYLIQTSKPGQVVTQVYQLESTGSYSATAGGPPHQKGVFPAKIIPLRERTIEQDGTRFRWRANSYDSQARPVSVTKSSAPIP